LALPIQYQIIIYFFFLRLFLIEPHVKCSRGSLCAGRTNARFKKFYETPLPRANIGKGKLGKSLLALASDVAESAEKDILHQCVFRSLSAQPSGKLSCRQRHKQTKFQLNLPN
jgi:hypothetical protein